MFEFWSNVVRFASRLKLYLFPAPGWRKRLLRFKAGTTSWPIPGAPEGSNTAVGPWPLEWTPCDVTFVSNEEGVVTGAKLEFHNLTSGLSGRLAEGEDAVSCARCSVHMHVAETDMETNLDVPLCPWCVRVAP